MKPTLSLYKGLSKKLLTIAFTLSLVAILAFSSASNSDISFLTAAVYFTGGRSTFHALLTISLLIILTLPLHGYFPTVFSQDYMLVIVRFNTRHQWFASSCVTLFTSTVTVITIYLVPIFLYAKFSLPNSIPLFSFIYVFFFAWLLMILFVYVLLLITNLLAMQIPLPVAVLSSTITYFFLGYLPTSIQWLDMLNPISNLYFDVHPDNVIRECGFEHWNTHNFPSFTMLYSIVYFTLIIGVILLAGWLKIRKLDILSKK